MSASKLQFFMIQVMIQSIYGMRESYRSSSSVDNQLGSIQFVVAHRPIP
jgi:hypothetical protein